MAGHKQDTTHEINKLTCRVEAVENFAVTQSHPRSFKFTFLTTACVHVSIYDKY